MLKNEEQLRRHPTAAFYENAGRQEWEAHKEVFLPYTSFDQWTKEFIANPFETWACITKYAQVNKPKPVHLYAMHCTHGPLLCSKQDWLVGLRKMLHTQKAGTIVGGAIEHVDTNIHCHVLVKTTYRLGKTTMATFEKNCGYIKYDLSSGDHGFTTEYMQKEYAFRSLSELDEVIVRINDFLNKN